MDGVIRHDVSAVRFGVDAFQPEKIAGWARSLESDNVVHLSLVVNDVEVGSFRADRYRADLTNMRADGRFAFRLTPFSGDWKGFVPASAKVQLKVVGSGLVLAEAVWDGRRSATDRGVQSIDGQTMRLNKEIFVVPLGERTANWKQGLLNAAKGLCDVSQEGGFVISAAYGTLLGGIREGSLIPHDDDVDLMLISRATTMMGAVKDFHRYQEFLVGRGIRVKELSNGQIHVEPAGAPYTVDVFLAWLDGGNSLSLTFAVKQGVAVDDVLPLGSITIDGVELPAPRAPESLLAAIYGPGWKVPDPTFKWNRPVEVGHYFAPIHNYQRGANAEYWSSYYAQKDELSPPEVPSQFALFALSVRGKPSFIVDLGCGSARDSLFFGANGIKTVGVDYADSAIEANSQKAAARGLERIVAFSRVDVSDLEHVQRCVDQVREERGEGTLAVYSRFFFHAIDESTEGAALLLTRELLTRTGDFAVFEFRTTQDAARTKVTPAHYRRYVDADRFLEKAKATYGLTCEYRVEGTGYAVFKADDAYVVRLVLVRGSLAT